MKKTRIIRTIKMIKNVSMLLAMVMFITTLPVNAEAKKLGKIPMGDAIADPWNWGEDETTIDFPQPYSHWTIDTNLNCKPGDTFTFTVEQSKFDAKNNDNFKIYGDIIWRSSDTDVATVNKKGKVTVKSEGNAAITASIRLKGTSIYGTKVDTEEVVYRHWIHSGPVLQLNKNNVKAVAKKAHGIDERDRKPVIRAKGSPEETKELFQSFAKEFNKYGHNITGEMVHEIGNFTYWW